MTYSYLFVVIFMGGIQVLPERGFAIHRLALIILSSILLVWGGVLALSVQRAMLPDKASGMVTVVFSPTMEREQVFANVLRADGVLVRGTGFRNIWIVYSDERDFVGRLRTQGAWTAFEPVSFNPVTLGGCFGIAPRLK